MAESKPRTANDVMEICEWYKDYMTKPQDTECSQQSLNFIFGRQTGRYIIDRSDAGHFLRTRKSNERIV